MVKIERMIKIYDEKGKEAAIESHVQYCRLKDVESSIISIIFQIRLEIFNVQSLKRKRVYSQKYSKYTKVTKIKNQSLKN